MFSCNDAEWLSETVGGLYAARTSAEFVRVAIESVYGQFRLVAAGCEELGNGGSFYTLHAVRCELSAPADVALHLHDHPFLPSLISGDLPPLFRIREKVSYSAWSRTDHYNGVARPMGFRDQMEVVGQSRPSAFMLGLNRDTVFSPRECHLARLLQPHFEAGWQRVRPQPQLWRGSVLPDLELSSSLRPVFINRQQCEVLRAYFSKWNLSTDLPTELKAWILVSLRSFSKTGEMKPFWAYVTESARGRLLIRFFPSQNGSKPSLSFMETPSTPDYFRLIEKGLTLRECEILHWAAQGKRDAEIATTINVTAKTVSKHMERILNKLFVETRSAAVCAARAHLDPLTE